MVAGAENRIEERTRFEDREIDVVVGMERVLARIRQGPDPVRAIPALSGTPVAAEMVEISPSGHSLTSIDAAPVPVATVDPDLQIWRVHDLSSRGYGLLVAKASADAVPLNGAPSVEALFLPGAEPSGKLGSVAIRAADSSATTPCRLPAGGSVYRIRMNRIAKKGADWVRIRFEIESKA